VCHDKGLHLLVEACERLVGREGLPRFELHAAGYLSPSDRPYLKTIRKRVAGGPLADAFFHHGELSREQKIEFLQTLDVFSTPTIYAESKGLPILEAWANGAPAVAPAHGSFPEMVAATGGGVLHRPHDAADLADKLGQLLADPVAADAMGRSGQSAVHSRYTAAAMADETLSLYRELRPTRRPGKPVANSDATSA
jgi:glycosyltransferase involved in cell wall biosynthesis